MYPEIPSLGKKEKKKKKTGRRTCFFVTVILQCG